MYSESKSNIFAKVIFLSHCPFEKPLSGTTAYGFEKYFDEVYQTRPQTHVLTPS